MLEQVVYKEHRGTFNGSDFYINQPDCAKVFICIAKWKIQAIIQPQKKEKI